MEGFGKNTRYDREGVDSRIEDAERLLVLNVEMNPASNFAKRTHTQVAIRKALAGGADSVAADYTALKSRYGALVGEQMLNGIGYDLLESTTRLYERDLQP